MVRRARAAVRYDAATTGEGAPMSVLLPATLFFLAVYAAVAMRWRDVPFHVAFKLARGGAALVLTGIGCYALWRWHELWPVAFLQRQLPASLEALLVWFVTGHFFADAILVVYGALRHRSSPRRDLIAHHLLGLLGAGIVLYFDVGAIFLAIALTTEVMPVTSGIAAWAELRRNAHLARRAVQARLAVLAGWRLPLWLLLAVLVVDATAADELVAFAHRMALFCLGCVVVLDVYWTLLCLRALREPS